jgi:putative hemolysin
MTLLWMAGLLVLSGLISASETAVFSLQAGERRRLTARHPAVARLMRRPTELLFTLLLTNLLINVAYLSVGAKRSLQLHEQGQDLVSVALALGSVAGLILLGEILPKTLAVVAAGQLVTLVAPLLLLLRTLLWPAVLLGVTLTRLIEAPLFRGSREPGAPGANDFKSAVTWRASRGSYHPIEAALLHDVIAFGQLRARDLMVPRTEVAFLDIQASREQWVAAMVARPHADYPVCDGSPDHLLGTICAVAALAQDRWRPRELIEPALIAPPSIAAERLIDRLQNEGRRVAILLDEHGGVAGVVGLQALSRAVLGELEDLLAAPGRGPIERRGVETLVVTGSCPLHVLREEAGVELPHRRARTVGGAVAEAVGRVPHRGDELLTDGWRLRVASVRGRRVERVVVRPVARGES